MRCLGLLVLFIVTCLYVVIGGVVFHFLEATAEETLRFVVGSNREEFLKNFTCISPEQLNEFLEKIVTAYHSGVVIALHNESAVNTNWDLYSSIFFATTVVTTIGYGNISPVTSEGRFFCALFAIIGIPLCLVVLAQIGIKMRQAFQSLASKLTTCDWCRKHPRSYDCVKISMVIVGGAALFVLIPAGVFQAVEKWSYGEGLYYSVITLTTIGFGDYVAGTSEVSGFYRICVACWIVVGLAWLSGVVSFVQDSYSKWMEKAAEKHQAKKRSKSKRVDEVPENHNEKKTINDSPSLDKNRTNNRPLDDVENSNELLNEVVSHL